MFSKYIVPFIASSIVATTVAAAEPTSSPNSPGMQWQALEKAFALANQDPGFKTKLKGNTKKVSTLVNFAAAVKKGKDARNTALTAAASFMQTYGSDLKTLDKQFATLLGGNKAYQQVRKAHKIRLSPASIIRSIQQREKTFARNKQRADKVATTQVKRLARDTKKLKSSQLDKAAMNLETASLILTTIKQLVDQPSSELQQQYDLLHQLHEGLAASQ